VKRYIDNLIVALCFVRSFRELIALLLGAV
jgi:hypothetical protein